MRSRFKRRPPLSVTTFTFTRAAPLPFLVENQRTPSHRTVVFPFAKLSAWKTHHTRPSVTSTSFFGVARLPPCRPVVPGAVNRSPPLPLPRGDPPRSLDSGSWSFLVKGHRSFPTKATDLSSQQNFLG